MVLLKNYKKRDPKTHKGVSSLLGQYFIKTEEINKSFAKMFSVVQEARHDADYEERVKITKQEAKKFLNLAKKFVAKMKDVANDYLKK